MRSNDTCSLPISRGVRGHEDSSGDSASASSDKLSGPEGSGDGVPGELPRKGSGSLRQERQSGVMNTEKGPVGQSLGLQGDPTSPF